MSPSHPLFRRFENEVTVGGQKLEWTTQGADFVARPWGADETIVWFFLGRADLGRSILQTSPRGDQFWAERTLRSRTFWRWWQLPSGEECFLQKNYGLFRTASEELVRFDFPVSLPDVNQMKGEDVEQFLKGLSSAESDLAAARLWAATSVPERVRQLFTLRGGGFDEFELLIQGALVLSREPQTRFAMRDVMIMPSRIRLIYEVHTIGEPHPVDRYFDILNRYFHLERTAQEWRGHDELGDPQDVPYTVFSSSHANQHEYLEAALNWRDFLRGKLPPEEIDALLPQGN